MKQNKTNKKKTKLEWNKMRWEREKKKRSERKSREEKTKYLMSMDANKLESKSKIEINNNKYIEVMWMSMKQTHTPHRGYSTNLISF